MNLSPSRIWDLHVGVVNCSKDSDGPVYVSKWLAERDFYGIAVIIHDTRKRWSFWIKNVELKVATIVQEVVTFFEGENY